MDGKAIGVAIGGARLQDIQSSINQAANMGIDAVWMATGGARLDSITSFAATAGQLKESSWARR